MDSTQIQQLRRFNRLVTRRVGALDDSYLKRGRPLGEARLIFEIGLDGAGARELRGALGLDSGYLSRLLRSLAAQGLIEVGPADGDARRRRARLTAKGRDELAAYERLSDDLARATLAPLNAAERERLLAAMGEVERLLRAGAVEIRRAAPDCAEARHCLGAYYAELARRFDAGFDPEAGGTAGDVEMAPPDGLFFLAWLDGRPVGCGGLKRVGEGEGEVKRLWTAPEARGLGVARRVMAAIEVAARAEGMTRLRLDTNRALLEAQALYRKLGYQEVARFNANPYAHCWFAKRL
jgi:DNA-binding MarR family transcriptional regulator/RimJ/RimL family protein N-acetyltransferase